MALHHNLTECCLRIAVGVALRDLQAYGYTYRVTMGGNYSALGFGSSVQDQHWRFKALLQGISK